MKGKRVGVFGLGRSGLGVAKAALHLGAHAIVADQSLESSLSKPELAVQARELGAELVLGWAGDWRDLGVDFVVTNPAVNRRHPKLLGAVAASIPVIGEVEFAGRISKAPIVALTGTNGKSTTAVMTYLCVQACGQEAVLCGNIYGSGYPESALTDAALASTPDQVLVAEISSFQLEWVQDFHPVSAGITNITSDHLDRYESVQEYFEAKANLLNNLGVGDFAVLPADDSRLFAPTAAATLRFGIAGSDAWADEEGMTILGRRVPKSVVDFEDAHNYLNAGTAALLTYGLLKHKGLAGDTCPDGIIEGLRKFRPLAHRMERLGSKNGVEIINNSMCTNPGAVIKSSQSVGKPQHLLLGGVNKKLEFEPLRVYLASHPQHLYLYGSNAADLSTMLGGTYPVFSTLKEAFEAAVQLARPGEAVMLSPGCASSDQFRDFVDRGETFRGMAKEWLNS